MTEANSNQELIEVRKRLDDLEKSIRTKDDSDSSRRKRLADLQHLVEKQKILIEVLRETVPAFGPKFDKLCNDRGTRIQDLSATDVVGIVFGSEA